MRSWGERAEEFERRPLWALFKWGAGLCIVIALIGVVLIPFGWGFAWLNETSRITGPTNARDQATAIVDDWQGLLRGADNACQAQDAPRGNANDPLLVESPSLAYAATYRRSVADYNRRMHNFFEAGLISGYPTIRDYPRTVPDFPETHGRHPDWCRVSEKLAKVHD